MANYNVGNIEIGAVVDSKNATSEIDKIIAKLNNVKNASKGAATSTRQIGSNAKAAKGDIDKLSKSFSKLFNLGKIYFLINYSKQFIQSVVKMVGYASDYVETLNKFEVSFGKLTEENLNNVNKITKAYGLARTTLMDYQATFNNMLQSLGNLTPKLTAQLSQQLSLMAIDYSSLFNVSIQRAMTSFQAALSGSVRPIRSVSGFDVSETSIFSLYQSLGGEKTTRQLTQLEKRMLRILAIYQQMQKTGAGSDFARTIDTFSNQVRILTEQIKEFGTIWGRIFLVQLKPVIQMINGLLLAFNELGELLTKEIEKSLETDINDEFANLGGNIEDTTDAVNELNASLSQLGLDQLNVLGGTNKGGLFDIDPLILERVKSISYTLNDVNFKAKEIANSILKWLGYTKDENGEITNLNENTEELKKKIKSIVFIITGLIVLVKGGSIVATIDKIATGFGTIGGIASSLGIGLGPVLLIITAISAVVVGIVDLLQSGSEQTENWFSYIGRAFKNMFEPGIENLKDGIDALLKTLGTIYESIIKPIAAIVLDVFVYTLMPIIGTAVEAFGMIFKVVSDIVMLVVDVLSPVINFILVVVQIISKVVTGIIAMVGDWISGFLDLIKSLLNLIIDGINWITSKMNLFHWKAPDWLGGWEIGFNIPEIPKFANGNVARQPTLGMFGEYAGASNNPEITTPQNILRETFNETLVPLVNAILKGDNEVVKAIKNQNLTLNINGRKLAENTMNDYNSVANRKGKLIFE